MSISTFDVSVGRPLHGASFGQSIKRFFQGYVRFSGRASRSEFWWATLFSALAAIAAQIPLWVVMGVLMSNSSGVRAAAGTAVPLAAYLLAFAFSGLVLLALLLPSYAVMWRRLQDANFHGALALLSVIGFGIVPLVLCIVDSNPAGIRFDPSYLATANGHPAYAMPSYGQQPHGPQAFGQQAPGQQATGQQAPGQQAYRPPASPAYADRFSRPTGAAHSWDGQPDGIRGDEQPR